LDKYCPAVLLRRFGRGSGSWKSWRGACRIIAPPRSVSFPAKAGNPGRRGPSVRPQPSRSTGSPGQAGRWQL